MQVAQVSFSSGGGAGSVAGTLNEALSRQGVYSQFINLSTSTLLDKPFENPKTSAMAALDEYLLKKRDFPNQLSVLRNQFARSPHFEHLDFEILNFHWIPGQLKVSSIATLAENRSGIVWTLHDMWPITGGCHYSQQCNAFKDSCTDCPACRTPFRRLIQNEQQDKKSALEGISDKFSFVAPSQWMAKLARESTVGKNLRIEVIPNPVQKISPNVGTKEASRRSLGIPEKTFVVSFAAANIEDKRKNLHLLLEALDFTVLDNPGLDIQLLLIGRGSKLEKQRFKVIQTGYLSKEHLMGTLKASDVFVNLSLEENLSVAAIEAMALSIPVIAANSAGNTDLVEEGKSGYLVKDSKDLCNRLASLAKNRQQVESLSQQALKRFENTFCAEKVTTRYVELYNSFYEN